ncbi:hypothetical protein TD95_000520 [Thielaviopsis punctulata]|uniref:RAD50-interacting protein 1 n=1 Tax=Thielaviopsis punctulata TaxID=72032 RepID=A0A0F4ZA00_9PEZI|nr:hypothetical protein TD95_000520 [Thielaviopsis punctulata]
MAELSSIDTRIADYLDDKLQSYDDFESLTELLATVEEQRNQLQEQLDTTIADLDRARAVQEFSNANLDIKINEFRVLQKSVDERVATATTAAAPTEAIQRLQEPLRKIQAVELAQSYLELLQDAHELKKLALEKVAEDPKGALAPYGELKALAEKVRLLHGTADEAAIHLLGYIETMATELWAEMKATIASQLEAILTARKWPMVDPESEIDDEWLICIDKVLDLQSVEIHDSSTTVSLLPFDVMAKVFISEFKYHFMSDKPTSAAQATTAHCFPWFLATIERWEDFFRNNLGHLMAAKVKDTPTAQNMAYVDPGCALVRAMLPIMKEKVMAVLNEAGDNPAFLSSFIVALMDLDDSIRTKFSYDDGSLGGWAGLTTEILERWFDSWFTAEKRFAMERLKAILEAPDSKTIDYDYGGAGKTKPAKASIKVTDLLRNITGQYRRLRKFNHKIKFLIGIQLDIMDEYHDYLRSGLELYKVVTSTVGRTLHGVSKEQAAALEGTGGMESLCKVYGSCDHIISTLKDWSNEEFFVALWYELQSRSKQGNHTRVTSTISVEQVKDRVSNAVESESQEGALFDETITAFGKRLTEALEMLVSAVADSHAKALRVYTGSLQWTTLIMARNLDFLIKILGTAPLRRVWRESLSRLQGLLWSEVLMRQNFTAFGAMQFSRDVEAISSLVERYIPGASRAMGSLIEGTRLLSLPVEAAEGGGPTLKSITDSVFTDNNVAKQTLMTLGMGDLSPANARNILERRVENQE